MLLGDPTRRLVFGLTLLLLAGVGVIWLRWHGANVIACGNAAALEPVALTG